VIRRDGITLKTAVITGGGSGLGKELAILLSKKGYHIHLLGRTEQTLKNTVMEIESDGGKATFDSLDLLSYEEIQRSGKKINNRFEIELLINNAGVGYFGPFTESTDQEMEEMFSTNVFGPIQLTKELLPSLQKHMDSAVLNIISTAGLRGKKHESLYVASKFAFRGWSESLQKEFEGNSPRFINAFMGGMNTPFWNQTDHAGNPEKLRSPREVAEIILNQYETENEIVIESKK
jgi:short-subunit dehydrogenase